MQIEDDYAVYTNQIVCHTVLQIHICIQDKQAHNFSLCVFLQNTESSVFTLHSLHSSHTLFGENLSILTRICVIKGPRVMRHMKTEVALLTATVKQRLAQHGSCDCHRSVLLLYVAVGDGGV